MTTTETRTMRALDAERGAIRVEELYDIERATTEPGT